MPAIAKSSSPEAAAPRPSRASFGARFLIGDWIVDSSAQCLERGDAQVALEPRHLAVLCELCRRHGEVVSAQELLDACWPNEPFRDNPVHKVVSGLRSALQDSAVEPRYLETIRKRGYRVVAPLQALSDVGPRGLSRRCTERPPFRGLSPFTADDADMFFGRDEEIRRLEERLAAQWRRGHPFVLLLGPSGSGKTSLVQAGLAPAMLATGRASSPRASSVGVADLGNAQGDSPWIALAGAMLDWEVGEDSLLRGRSIDSLARSLRDDPAGVLRDLELALDEAGRAGAVGLPLLVLDRLEALLTGEPQLHAFLRAVDALVRARLCLVVAVCRDDFYAQLARHPELMRDKDVGAHVDLAPPDANALAQMIRLPARAAGLTFGVDPSGFVRLDDRLCTDALQASDALPLLQYVLQALYEERTPGGVMGWAAYGALGGFEGAIGRRAEAVFSSLPQPQQDAWARLLPRLVRLGPEDAGPRGRWCATEELESEDERALAKALVDARMLVASHRHGAAGLRVAHEAVLRQWPRVGVWIAQHRKLIVLREELQPWLHRWLESGRAGSLLLPRGMKLLQAAELLAQAGTLFGAEERAFVAASMARLKRQARQRWANVAALCVLALCATVAAVRSTWLARVAAQRQRQAEELSSFMLGDLADRLRPIGKLDLLASIGQQSLRILGDGKNAPASPQEALQRAKALVAIGEVNSSRGKDREDVAVPALREAQRLLRAIGPSGLPAADYYRVLGASSFWLGQIAFDADQLPQAAAQMEDYRVACERWLAAAPGDAVAARTELAFAVSSLGSVEMRRMHWAEARDWFGRALALKLAALAAQPLQPQAQDAVASARTWLGQSLYVQGDAARALEMYEAALETRTRLLAVHPEEKSRARDIGVLDVRRAEALQALGRDPEALDAMARASARLEDVAASDRANLRWQAEALHARAGWLLLQLDAGALRTESSESLRAALATVRAATPGRPGSLVHETRLRLDAADAMLALRAGDRARTALIAERALADLHASAATGVDSWQLAELQARLGQLRIDSADPTGHAQACARTAAELQPAGSSGLAGVVTRTWLSAQACAATVPRPSPTPNGTLP